jgi:adenosyl cobinamide kinase/adenosyl cobinamide phosphate guanylyltransferase
MNDRIKELSKQAEVKWLHQEDVIYSTMTLEQFEKFAELIVRECLDIVANADMSELEGPDPEDVLYVACKQIKEHFGVEE